MKTSSPDPGERPAKRSKAWSYLISNLLVLPGLGSVMARRKVSGYSQMLLAIVGFFMTLVALAKIALAWVQDFQLPADPALYKLAIYGMAIFIVSWVWSLITSLEVLRESEKSPE
jgi:hypothetical protein